MTSSTNKLKRLESQPENPFSKLVSNQTIVEIPEFQLENGDVIYNVPIAYKTWGKLNKEGNNCMVICHALTGSADVSDWWGPLLGKDKAFDPTKFFIICSNSFGSPYGSASPVTKDPETGEIYGPEFPLTTIRDDVNAHKLILDDLGVKQIAIVIGGSMGGMLSLEWLFLGKEYVKTCVALATSARHSAWCISWGEAQRQCIYSDPKYEEGYYSLDDPPSNGLSAARMAALLTYRSRNSFEARFGRNDGNKRNGKLKTLAEDNWTIHNDGLKSARHVLRKSSLSSSTELYSPQSSSIRRDSTDSISSITSSTSSISPPHFFSAQSYLRYQGEKFVKRFDANCYIAITRKLDTHDVSRDRPEFENSIEKALGSLQQPTLVIGIKSDALFTYSEQQSLAKYLPKARLEKIDSPEGHDAFLLEFESINKLILDFENENLKELMLQRVAGAEEMVKAQENNDMNVKKDSVFGEVEADITQW
ncbi:hypothetical protein PACTADRAFT_42429 [Pachysolen tannophilus NRRL Y-2460]|uniref:AB hydrolase-1 domain-containing protein n=1 Tax=Pachysolen tannophilus NRRL Y-2460 TaxID=669874 RepID=A0A1E4TU55_PACTA|nr:hypothetical protein PACTADRAFT_42429 [Pachysolen tannophilus NRRL Y-2460]